MPIYCLVHRLFYYLPLPHTTGPILSNKKAYYFYESFQCNWKVVFPFTKKKTNKNNQMIFCQIVHIEKDGKCKYKLQKLGIHNWSKYHNFLFLCLCLVTFCRKGHHAVMQWNVIPDIDSPIIKSIFTLKTVIIYWQMKFKNRHYNKFKFWIF